MSDLTLTVRYYAAAGAAAGVPDEQVPRPGNLAELKTLLVQAHPSLETVLAVSSLLLDGVVSTSDDVDLAQVTQVDVLPPFAGG